MMKLDAIRKAYCYILLEEVLTDESTLKRISALPSPLNIYFMNMREAMFKASTANTDEELTAVNTEVNVWRDKIVKYWIKNSKKLNADTTTEINEVLIMITERYRELMGGCNTGYSEVG